jgi:hypothetical protein
MFMAPVSPGSPYEFWIIDAISGEVIKQLSANLNRPAAENFADPIVSYDGKRVLFYTFRLDSSNPLSENRGGELHIFDIESSNVSTVPSSAETGVAGCIGQPRLAGVGNNLIVYTTGGCTHYFGPYRWVHVLSIDGNYHEKLFMTTGNTAIVSPDGSSMVFCCDAIKIGELRPEEVGLYKLDFSHPMPELNLTLISLTIALTVLISFIVLTRFANWMRLRAEPNG